MWRALKRTDAVHRGCPLFLQSHFRLFSTTIPDPYVTPSRTRMLINTTSTSYDEVYREFIWPQPEQYNIGVDISDKWAHTNRIAVIQEDDMDPTRTHSVPFKDISQLSNRLCNALQKQCGLKVGDRVGILMSQSVETVIAHAAVYKCGAIAVPLFVLFAEEALSYRIRDSACHTIIVEPSKLEEIRALHVSGAFPQLQYIIVAPSLSSIKLQDSISTRGGKDYIHLSNLLVNASTDASVVETKADDPALIIYTSGTTGPPKGALHAHRVLLGHLPGVEFPHSFFPQPDDIMWTPADWAWIGGLIDVMLPSLHHGVPVVAHRFKKFDAEACFELMQRHKIRNMFMPPTALKRLRDIPSAHTRYKLSVRSIGSGGESLGDALLDWGKETFGITIQEFYGQTECNLVLGNCTQLFPPRAGSMGKPIPGHAVHVVDEHGKPLPPNTVGNIAIKQPDPVMFLRYWNMEKATLDKYTGGYLLTGDLARVDEDGYFWFVGRSDDVIKSAGYRIGPAEIEDCLLKHPSVSTCAVIGIPDASRGEAIKAYIVLRHDIMSSLGIDIPSIQNMSITLDQRDRETYHILNTHPTLTTLKHEISGWVKTKLAAHEYPRMIDFVFRLPQTTTGKIIRKDLKKIWHTQLNVKE